MEALTHTCHNSKEVTVHILASNARTVVKAVSTFHPIRCWGNVTPSSVAIYIGNWVTQFESLWIYQPLMLRLSRSSTHVVRSS